MAAGTTKSIRPFHPDILSGVDVAWEDEHTSQKVVGHELFMGWGWLATALLTINHGSVMIMK